MIQGTVYRRTGGDFTMTVLSVDEKTVTCFVQDQYGNDREVIYPKVGFVASLGTGHYEIVKRGRP